MKSTALRIRLLAAAVCAGWISLHGQQAAPQTAAERNIWTIGIYKGPSPFELSAPSNVKNPVLTGADVMDMKDLNVDTVAHPFLVAVDSRYYVFSRPLFRTSGLTKGT